MNNQSVKWMLTGIVVLTILITLLPMLSDTAPIRPHENDVVFDGYTIIALVCYKCGVTFELGSGGYILGRIHCNNCIRSSENE